jgi:glutamate-5-semialdehyde dehydrogenase
MLIHRDRLHDLPAIVEILAQKNVILYADHEAYHALENIYPLELLFLAQEHHYGTEFLSLKMSIKTVAGLNEALEHIAQYSSKHSEAIVAEDTNTCDFFLRAVDAACVYANASTAFTDGGQFELGAEIGISTQKLHARGPMALRELTSYKWIVRGTGNIRT